MTRRFALLIAATFVIVAAPASVMCALPEPRPADVVDILVDGVAQPRFAHGGRWYFEAHKGREYAIRLRNPYGVRVAVALSVDGLNTIDARQTTAVDARKWVLGPHETVTISGWQTSWTAARRFEFTTEARSYGQALGKTANLGVISAVFFKERAAAISGGPRSDVGSVGQAAESSAPREEDSSSAARQKTDDEYAATGMGRRTDHAVTRVWLDLETTPAQTVDIRYEFRPQLVRLGIAPIAPTSDPLLRRERASGFDSGFSPEPPHQR